MARYPHASKIYEVAELFANECLIGDGSLLWQDRRVWTRENLNRLWSALVENPDTGNEDYMTKLADQLSGEPANVIRLMAEATAFYCLFPSSSSLGSARKKSLVEEVMSLSPDMSDPTSERWNALLSAFEGSGIGATGTGYNTARDNQISFVLAFAKVIKKSSTSSIDEIDPQSATYQALELIREVRNHRPFASFNIMRHLLWPDRYERTASADQKERMAGNLSAHFGFSQLGDVDQTIQQVRTHMEESGDYPPNFDMYDDSVRPLWDFKKSRKSQSLPIENSTKSPEPKNTTSSASTPTITDLAAKTFLDESFLRDIESLLSSKKQLIFEGPPGSGKTYVAEQFARYFAGQSLDDSAPTDQVELVQFHQSYSYEDFVEGIRPRTNEDGQLVYDVEPGIFLELADKAWLNTDKNFVLIIDEVNRGNVSRILGELMLLLEYRDKLATLPYSKTQLQIPPNLYIIGTMNTADRSLSQIDYALRRRFYFLRFMSVENDEAPVLDGWLRQQGLDVTTHSTVLQSFIKLNQQLENDLGTDDLQVGHSYFMDDNIHNDRQQQHIWNYAVLPLIREYLYHHRERDSLMQKYQRDRILGLVNPEPENQVDPEATNISTGVAE